MFREKQYLQLPGPTPVPPRVLRALSEPMINHRGGRIQRAPGGDHLRGAVGFSDSERGDDFSGRRDRGNGSGGV